MYEAALTGLMDTFTGPVLLASFIGILIGTFVAVTPQGLGTPLAYALLIPIVTQFDPAVAVAVLLALGAVTNTGNTFLPVLMSIPGGAGAQAIILDGYPMGKRGEAKRALGAGFTASIIGGIFGFFILAVSIPIARPLVLSVGSPELFMLALWGVTMVAVLAGPQPLKGMAAAAFGLMLTTIGMDRNTGVPRFMFDEAYLITGIPITIIALGLFGIPAALDLTVRRSGVEQQPAPLVGSVMEGVRDTFRNWWLVLRCSVIGVWVGFVPGLGSQVADWIAYGHAAQTCKGAHESFGKGDVRGVIAPDSTNSAKDGGALIPTLAFGVPGSFTLALFMLALLSMGITPGPKMLQQNLDLVWLMIWVSLFSAIIGAFICFALIVPLAKLSVVRYTILAPLILVMTFVGAYSASRTLMDLVFLLVFGVIGYIMRATQFPRPPVILGVVLGGLMERYLFISYKAYTLEFLLRPGVLILLGLIVASLYFGLRVGRRHAAHTAEPDDSSETRP